MAQAQAEPDRGPSTAIPGVGSSAGVRQPVAPGQQAAGAWNAPSEPKAAPKAPAPRRKRRWIVRIGLGLFVLLLLAILAIQIILITNLPRNLVISAIQKQLGLRVTAKSLTTGWLGKTELKEVDLSLPLEDQAFAMVPDLTVKHSNLIWLIITRSLTIQSITIDHARLYVLQDAAGTWNLQSVAQLIARAGGSNSAAKESDGHAGTTIPVLPSVMVSDATAIVTDNQHRTTTITPVSVSGFPDGPLVWNYQASVPDHFQLKGKVAPGGNWSHEVDLSLVNLGSWASPWISNWSATARLSAHWSGQFSNDQLGGRLEIQDAQYGATSARGILEITTQGGFATALPKGIKIEQVDMPSLNLSINDGSLELGATDLKAIALGVAIGGGQARLDGNYTRADGTGSLTASWRDVVFPSSITHKAGKFSASFVPSLGQKHLRASFEDGMVSRNGKGTTQFDFDAAGPDLNSLAANLKVGEFRLETIGHQIIDLSGVAASITASGDGYTLQDVHLGTSHPIVGRGAYVKSKNMAWLTLNGRGWPVPGAGPLTMDFDFNSWATPRRVRIEQLYARVSQLSVSMDADYIRDQPKPVSADVYITATPAVADVAPSGELVAGALDSHLSVNGTLMPLDLSMSGDATGNNLQIRQRPLGNLKISVQGDIESDPNSGLNRASIYSNHIQIFDGDWAFRGYWPVENSLLRFDQVQVSHLSLQKALDRKDMGGTLDGQLTIDVKQFTPNGLIVGGGAQIHDLRVGDPTKSAIEQRFAADQVLANQIDIRDGIVNVRPIELSFVNAGIAGTATASASTTLEHPTQMAVQLHAIHWPVKPANGPVLAIVNADGQVDAELSKLSATGHLDIGADTSFNSKAFAKVNMAIDLHDRIVQATRIQSNVLDGQVIGDGIVDLDAPYKCETSIDWTGINLSGMAEIWPDLKGTVGRLNGSFRMAPSATPRPLGPLAFTLNLHPLAARAHNVPLDDAVFHGFIGDDRGNKRLVLDDSPSRQSTIKIANGQVRVWARVTRYSNQVFQSLVSMDLVNLNLADVMKVDPKTPRTPGLLSGNITVVGRPGRVNLAFGDGHLDISKSDLANLGPISILYDAMHLSHDANDPTGTGSINFRLYDNTLNMTSLRYFDRGAEVRGDMIITDISKLLDSPITGTIVGSARPFKALSLPGFGDLEGALAQIQRDAASIQLVGTVRKPGVQFIPFGAIGQDMRDLLLGDVGATTGASAQ